MVPDVKKKIETVRIFIERGIWGRQLSSLSGIRRFFLKWLRTLSLAGHGFVADRCSLRAAALTLVFMFSLAPAMAVGFAVAAGFGAQDRIRPLLYRQLGIEVDESGQAVGAPEGIMEMLQTVEAHLRETNIEALGLLGMLVVLYAAYKVLSAIENAMNYIWGVHRRRKMLRRLVDYTAVMAVSPILLILTALLMASLQSESVMAQARAMMPQAVIQFLAGSLSVAMAVVALGFLYFFFPNTRVRPVSALVGGLVAAVLLQLLQFFYFKAQVGVARYNAIYGTFAAVPIFLLWLYFSWLVVLLGAELSYAHANQSNLEYGGLSFDPSMAYQSQLALGTMALVTHAFIEGTSPPDAKDIASNLAAPPHVTRDIVGKLIAAHLLVELQGDKVGLHPARPPDTLSVGQVIETVEAVGDESDHTLSALKQLGIADVFRDKKLAASGVLAVTLGDLARRMPAAQKDASAEASQG